jgi:hypothetical protein
MLLLHRKFDSAEDEKGGEIPVACYHQILFITIRLFRFWLYLHSAEDTNSICGEEIWKHSDGYASDGVCGQAG